MPDDEPMKVDMSAKAVTARLRRVGQLRRLCLILSRSRPLPPPANAGAPAEPTAHPPSAPAPHEHP